MREGSRPRPRDARTRPGGLPAVMEHRVRSPSGEPPRPRPDHPTERREIDQVANNQSSARPHIRGAESTADMVRTHQTNPAATGREAENQSHILVARRTAAGNEIKAQQRRI